MNELRARATRVAAATVAAALLLSTVDVGTAAAAEQQGGARLQEALDELRDLGAVGAQGQVSAGWRDTVARSGVADRTTGAPMPAKGAFRIGSDTKTFVSVVVLQLAGEHRLSLDDTVERWLPGTVRGNGNDGRRVTVRQLLQHTSGIADFTDDMAALGSAGGRSRSTGSITTSRRTSWRWRCGIRRWRTGSTPTPTTCSPG